MDARPLYSHAKTAGYLYQAHLRHELTRRLGVAWGPVRNGCADLAGIPRPVLQAFSRRRGEIETALAARGASSAKAAQAATLATRKAKAYAVTPDTLARDWTEGAAAHGLDQGSLAALLGRVHSAYGPLPAGLRAEKARSVPWYVVCPSTSSLSRGAVRTRRGGGPA